MNIALLADIHSNLEALEAVLDDIKKFNVEKIISAGDQIGYNANPNEVIELLMKHYVICVDGNHEAATKYGTEMFNFNEAADKAIKHTINELNETSKAVLKLLQHQFTITTDTNSIYMVHGTPENPIQGITTEKNIGASYEGFDTVKANIFITGATHKPHIINNNNKLYINPGSVGQPRDNDPRASYMILNTETKETIHRRVTYNIDLAASKTAKIDQSLADRLFKGI